MTSKMHSTAVDSIARGTVSNVTVSKSLRRAASAKVLETTAYGAKIRVSGSEPVFKSWAMS
jgi:hypothetical protein